MGISNVTLMLKIYNKLQCEHNLVRVEPYSAPFQLTDTGTDNSAQTSYKATRQCPAEWGEHVPEVNKSDL